MINKLLFLFAFAVTTIIANYNISFNNECYLHSNKINKYIMNKLNNKTEIINNSQKKCYICFWPLYINDNR